MTSRPPTPPLEPRLLAAYARVRRALITRHALRATAASLVLLVACVTAGLALPRDPISSGARLLLFVLGSVVALAAASIAMWRETPRWDAWLESLELRFPGLKSLLRNAVDMEHEEQAPAAAHTSSDLADAVRSAAAQRLEAAPLRDTVPGLRARVPLVAAAAAALSLVAASALSPGATRAAWATMWNPASAAPPMTLEVDPGNVTVVPGAALAVRARIDGTSLPPRLVGNGPSPQPVLESTAGGGHRWRFDLPPVTRARDYAVRVAALASPTYHIALEGSPRAVSFSSAITSPAYARLPVQVVSGTRGDLSALAGSRAAVEITFDRDLESLSASVNSGLPMTWSAVTPRRWHGTLVLNGDGAWQLHARAATGEASFRYRLSVIPDAPPVLTVATPEGDLDLPAGQLVPYDAIIQDDLGVSELKLEWRKTASDPWQEESLARFGDEPREARAAARWDASPLALLPGESGVFRFVAYDNARPGPRGKATSVEFRLRFPTLSDLYASIEDRQENVSKALERAAEQTREVQKSLDKLQRQPQQGKQGPSFERSEEMKKAAERQQDVAEKVNQAANDMRESLEQAAERQAFQEQLQKKLKEMSEILKDIQSQEFKDALKRMQEALQKMDRRAMEETLPQLQAQNKEMLQQIERSLELLKQLREEERLEALARRADDLKARQDELNQKHGEMAEDQQKREDQQKAGDSKSDQQPKAGNESRDALTQQQKQAAEDTRQLAKDARESSKSSDQADAKQRLEEAANELEQQASEQQEEAGKDSESGDSQSAQSAGQKASESLSRASSGMRSSAAQQQQERDARNLAAVRRASQDLVALSQSAQQNTEGRQQSPNETADAQTDLAEGVARVADSLSTLSQQTPFMSNKIAAALGRAMQGLQQSGREMSQGSRERGQQTGRGASASLNEAVKELRNTEQSMCQQPGQGTGGKTATQRLGEVGKQQAQLNKQSREIARKMSQQMAMTQGDAAEMRRLADEQRRIREQLEEVRRDEEAKQSLLGRLEDTQKKMDEVEESIRQGDVGDDIEQKQTQILSRLLDAQRSIHRRDFDPQREARRGEDIARPSPAALAKDLFRENDRLRQDLLKADADRVPSQYRTLIEAYLRALNGSPK